MKKIRKRKKVSSAWDDRIFHAITTAILVFVLIIVGYPVLYVAASSFSSNAALNTGRVFIWPVEFTLDAYKFVAQYKQVWIGYRNTIFYVVAGVCLTLFMTVSMAYPLSKKYYQGRKFVTTLIIIAMMTTSGLIPVYMLKKSLGMVNTVWPIILSAALPFRSVIVLRTAFAVPGELYDAATIDGANEFQSLMRIALPLSKPTLSVVLLWNVVGRWNEYFDAMIYLHDQNKWPLQLFLRQILTAGQKIDASLVTGTDMLAQLNSGTEGIKYALIVMSTVPVLLLYQVVQKFFKTGVMTGALKG